MLYIFWPPLCNPWFEYRKVEYLSRDGILDINHPLGPPSYLWSWGFLPRVVYNRSRTFTCDKWSNERQIRLFQILFRARAPSKVLGETMLWFQWFICTPVARRKSRQSRVPNDPKSKQESLNQNISIKRVLFSKCFILQSQPPREHALHLETEVRTHRVLLTRARNHRRRVSPHFGDMQLSRGVLEPKVSRWDTRYWIVLVCHMKESGKLEGHKIEIITKTKEESMFRHQWKIHWNSSMEEWRVTDHIIDEVRKVLIPNSRKTEHDRLHFDIGW